jgi:predicted phage terminase large subunit-like protein
MTTAADLAILQAIAIEQARRSFWAFRQYIRPRMILTWWQRDIARELQLFYEDMLAGRRPKLVIQAPPQHGKSDTIKDFIAWLAGKQPGRRTIYASFSERLGIGCNLYQQRTLDSERYQLAFPETRLSAANAGVMSGYLRNRDVLEFVDTGGYFRNTTVNGAITGEGLDLGVIDDPVKGREEANSATVRDKTWDWFNDDFGTRFADDAGLLIIMTRWHVDDLAGRLIAADPSVKVLSYPAIAEADEEHRREGEVLFPELKSLDFLLEKKLTMDPISWEALYQQKPVLAGGNLFKIDQFRTHRYRETRPYVRRAIYADTAQKTGEKNDYSVFQVWGLGKDGIAYLIDQVRGKFEAPELEKTARTLWGHHSAMTAPEAGKLVAMKVEDKVSGTGLIQQLARGPQRVPVLPIKRGTTDKYTRAMDVLPSIASGMVSIPEDAPWTRDLLSELAAFPSGPHDDQVDPLVDAIGDTLLKRTSYNIDALI